MLSGLYLYQIDLGFIILQTWGTLVAVGCIAGLLFSLIEARKNKIDTEIIWNVVLLVLFGMSLGGKFFDFILSGKFDYDFHSGFSLIKGAMLSGILVLTYFKIKKYNSKKILDILTPGLIISLIIARIGCFFISDHVGKVTSFPWGMLYLDGNIRHPVALYHIIFLSVILSVILKIKKYFEKDGVLLYSFLLLYSFFRFIADFSRCNDLMICDHHFYGLTFSQWISIPVFFFSLYEIIFKYKLFRFIACDRINNIDHN